MSEPEPIVEEEKEKEGEVAGEEEQPEIDEEYPNETEIHPLNSTWTLWVNQPKNKGVIKEEEYGGGLRQVYTFSTVEDFWRCQNSILKISELVIGSSFSLFKKGIRPEWEDGKNKNGGQWQHTIAKPSGRSQRGRNYGGRRNRQQPVDPRKLAEYKETIDKVWEKIMCLSIGECFGDLGDKINGIMCNSKRWGAKFMIWISDWEEKEGTMGIGNKMKELLALEGRRGDMCLQFQPFSYFKKFPNDRKKHTVFEVFH